MKKLRLLKIAVKPFFIIDDGENVTEVDHPVTIIPSNEWSTYSSERFPREVSNWENEINEISLNQALGVDTSKFVYDELPRDSKGNFGTQEGNRNTIIKNLDEIKNIK